MRLVRLLSVFCLWALAGCSEQQETARPSPVELTRDAVGHFCGMTVVDHPGPKGQAFVAGQDAPLWFSSVRDTVAFILLPEESNDLLAIYVNDMAQARDWAAPPPAWIPADEAVYVIASARRGGMGALEAVPFSSEAAARDFIGEYGGCAVSLKAIPRDYVLGDAASAEQDWCDGVRAPGVRQP